MKALFFKIPVGKERTRYNTGFFFTDKKVHQEKILTPCKTQRRGATYNTQKRKFATTQNLT